MFLRFRPVHKQDFEECFRCVLNRSAFDDIQERSALLQMWSEFLEKGKMIGAVMEDLAAPVGKRIVWYCSKIFITAQYACYLCNGEHPPYVARQIFDLWRQGQELPMLSLEEIRRINSDPSIGDGLTILVLHCGSPDSILLGKKWPIVADKLIAFTEYFTGGYRTCELLEEFYDDFTFRMALGAGFTLRTEYAPYYNAQNMPLPPADCRPRLVGATREEALKRPGTLVSAIFQYEPPCFWFKRAEQELLLHALLGATDEELAAFLNIAAVTVKKRWQSIYERVNKVMPTLFTSSHIGFLRNADADSPQRGPEKRRQLLAYLHYHFEELRPLYSYLDIRDSQSVSEATPIQ